MSDRTQAEVDMLKALAHIFMDEQIGERAREIARQTGNALDPIALQDLGGGLYRVGGIRRSAVTGRYVTQPTDPAWPCSHCGSRDHNTGWHDHTRTQPTEQGPNA